MITWPSQDDTSVVMCIAAVSDASHGNESEYLHDWDEVETFWGRGAKVLFICDTRLVEQGRWSVHLVGVLKASCRKR